MIDAATYFEAWCRDSELFIERSTYEARCVYVHRHIAPYFAGIDLAELTPALIHRYAIDKLRGGRLDGSPGGLSMVSVRKHLSIIRQALNEAVILGYLSSNPAAAVRLPKRRGKNPERIVFLSADECRELLQALHGTEFFPIVLVALYYGLRRSEVLGLRWEAVDFAENVIRIEHTVVKYSSIECKDTTKTDSSRRTYQMLPEVRDLLLAMCGGADQRRRGYIFARSDGSPMRPDSLTRGFQRALARAGLPRMRFHDLRHSTASILFDHGWSLEDVKNWLGHADIETTSNIYLHYTRSRKILVGESLSNLLKI